MKHRCHSDASIRGEVLSDRVESRSIGLEPMVVSRGTDGSNPVPSAAESVLSRLTLRL
jgi:hypothetical protein